MYHLFVAEEGGCSTIRQRQAADIFCENIHIVVSCNSNIGGNPQKTYVERTGMS